MKFILWLLFLTLDGAAYYEYTWQQQTSAGFKQQMDDGQARIDAIEAENKKLAGQKNYLNQEVAYMATELSTMQGSTVEQKKVNELGVHAPDSSELGNITTLLGKTFQNCQLLKVESDGITVSYAQGITKILYAYLPPDWQKKFGYDPQKAVLVNEADIRFREQSQQAAGAASQTSP
jgi:hypothetical protein